jgi:hypothetical protein
MCPPGRSPLSSLAYMGLGASLSLLLLACSGGPKPEPTPRPSHQGCPGNLIAVVSNNDRVSLDVYNGSSVIGVVAAGSSARFAVMGNGGVRVAATDRGYTPGGGVRHTIRFECSE